MLAAAGENPQKGLDVLGQVYAGLVVDQSEASQQELAQCGPALAHAFILRRAALRCCRLRAGAAVRRLLVSGLRSQAVRLCAQAQQFV